MISFVENKPIDWNFIQEILERSVISHHWSNFGPVSILLEERIAEILNVDQSKSVVACASGTVALFALVEMHNYLAGKYLRWVVCSFNFHCARQGPLKHARIVDCDRNGMIDLGLVGNEEYDAILVTNPFGVVNSLENYINKGKIVICDSASAFDALIDCKVDEIISFHHTKPWGFGEGGCAIISKKYQNLFRSIINFGIWQSKDKTIDSDLLKFCAFNGKLSETSSAFILQRLEQIDQIREGYIKQYNRVASIARKLSIEPLITRQITHIPHCVPLLHDNPTGSIENSNVKLHKYYKPLEKTPVASDIYDRIVCVPCHREINAISDSMLEVIL